MYLGFIQKAAFECLLISGSEREQAVRELLEEEGNYLERMAKTLDALLPPSPSADRKRRSRG
jgi:hypothetical protein